MEFGKLVPVPQYTTACGKGCGLAACPSLGLLVTSDYSHNTLFVWSLSSGGGAGAGSGSGLTCVCTLGGDCSPAPMQFDFQSGDGLSGFLAFTPPPLTATPGSPHRLLVTDHGHNTVHVVDVVNRAHAGYLAAPGSIAGPHGVAARGDLVAVSAWKEYDQGNHKVHIYQAGSGGGSHWTKMRVIGGGFGGCGTADGQFKSPYGLRFSGDGSAICVADRENDRVSMFRVGDGGFVRHIATGLDGPLDVEEVEGGWVVACFRSHTVEFVSDGGDGGRPSLGKAGGGYGIGDGEFQSPSTMALVPGLGLVVRECWNYRLQVFSTPDMLAMRTMSDVRIGWMTATYRAIVNMCRRGGS